MEKRQIILDIAAYGWQGESWQEFYPSDLPEGWCLDYYSNEYRAVVVPGRVWQNLDEDILAGWVEAVHDEFRFYFEKAEGESTSVTQLKTIATLGKHWGGWVSQSPSTLDDVIPSIWYEGDDQSRQMRETIDRLYASLGSSQQGVIVVSTAIEPWQVTSDMRQLVELMGFG